MSRRRVPRAARNDAQHEEALQQRQAADSLAVHARELAESRIELAGLRHPEAGRGAQIGGRASRGEQIPAPVAVHVLDAIVAVDDGVLEQYWLAASTLRRAELPRRAGEAADAATTRRLRFLGSVAADLARADLEQVVSITIRLRDFTRSARTAAGHVMAPYLREQPCDACAERSVWVEPQNLSQRCSNPSCADG